MQVPAGLIDKDKSAEQAAERELREETGACSAKGMISADDHDGKLCLRILPRLH